MKISFFFWGRERKRGDGNLERIFPSISLDPANLLSANCVMEERRGEGGEGEGNLVNTKFRGGEVRGYFV